jgi:hypothetical protein
VETGQTYYYWVRSSDNIHGSNTTGYASGYSDHDTGWAVESLTSVTTNDLKDNVRISPNPCDEYVRISMADGRDGLLKLYGPGGRLILQRSIDAEMLLETGTLPEGLYILELITNKGETYTARLLISH